MLICQNAECPCHDKPVRTRKQIGADGTKIRVCVKCGKPITASQ
jgi:hypothetical protein